MVNNCTFFSAMDKIKVCGLMLAFVMMGTSAVAQNVVDKQGRRQGHWIKNDKDGSKIFEGDFKDGVETGVFKYYYPDGTLRIENDFAPDGKSCTHKAYDEKGRLLATGFFTQKNRDGEWKFYTEAGKLIKIATYKMGVKEGAQVIFTAEGDTAEVSYWKNNKRDGRWWKRIGKKGYITGTYKEGGMNGVVREYDEEGQKIREGNYKEGSKHGVYQYFEGGRLSVDEMWDMGRLQDRKILVLQPEPVYVSVFKIACLVPKGKKQVTIYTKNGESVLSYEPADVLFGRLGDDIFTIVNRKSRIMADPSCILGLKKDSEGREVLEFEPQLPFDIFPDEDCQKLIKSLQREGFDQ